ncbi:MAG: undecaprenyldiphospho-muramoylpentapeptide beta-N-acetylglucosaminyltransferase [Ignavibacteriaceae bacterium]|nr:undecaprenyldiphospho-muramoylpentapeptide beta-N-acetylglucosaminyltransferase [Ignavibacteria bacterium]MBT8392481.1 undecaprenyldiphospho-muramoylpentapeptide beta-N-acetylglucosaminyltransferase [Ignavibacteria bacterium]NNL19888.1 undecaprenyldiphospho-muramoylpentapeptide beta-N-acetylglucosaminyltransferase [Ignavibacteriaceae bacterium]
MRGSNYKYKLLFTGGGTGGHLFPAVAVAEHIKEMKPAAEILFVGTKNKIEGKIIPKLGFAFKSIWIQGFYRKFDLRNLLFPVRLIVSLLQSLFINIVYKPNIAIGSGGYAAGPVIWAAWILGAKIILIEQNSYPGVTTRLLERYANEVHLSFEDSKKYLKRKEIHRLTGNPIRKNLGTISKQDASISFGLSTEKKTLLVLGGSLGARSINNAVKNNFESIVENGIQIIWQTGKYYYEEYKNLKSNMVKVYDFIEDMNSAYSACDLLVARAGATTIAEVLVLGIPAVFVPSPNVAGNHQFYNAKSLSENNASLLVEDNKISSQLAKVVSKTISSKDKLSELSKKAQELAKPNAAKEIAESVIKFAEVG